DPRGDGAFRGRLGSGGRGWHHAPRERQGYDRGKGEPHGINSYGDPEATCSRARRLKGASHEPRANLARRRPASYSTHLTAAHLLRRQPLPPVALAAHEYVTAVLHVGQLVVGEEAQGDVALGDLPINDSSPRGYHGKAQCILRMTLWARTAKTG